LPNFVEFVERVIKDFDLIAHWHAIQQSFGIRAPASCFGVGLGCGATGLTRSAALIRSWASPVALAWLQL
jgi:hypothetical protein